MTSLEPVVTALTLSDVAPDAVTVDQDTVTVTSVRGGRITVSLTSAGRWHVDRYAANESLMWSGTFADHLGAVGLTVATAVNNSNDN